MSRLANLIEKKRQQLFYLSKLYGLAHPQTIQCSQKLDILINISMKNKVQK
ncbi:aspartyl-phosphate phosphatase Spo0E family protein [Ectobacillus funiculus]|uniref:aspartyl-phosphate phosphatase Spo0E family protein n=1 Tax=Ectobacillus funiculus TaxID=137993 RepID=UPI00101C5D09|nr:aspartyl-phosphate phosphatase Spo0E family protein [Ectobacillus funiculus]